MNRTDRLYALVEELRASAPRARSAQRLAERFEVTVRTVQRDILALQEAGVPIWATPGPGGGYRIDPGHTLPPLNFTPAEAAVLLATVTGQDVEETTDGHFRIFEGTAPDRVIPTVDPEARHGHKTTAPWL